MNARFWNNHHDLMVLLPCRYRGAFPPLPATVATPIWPDGPHGPNKTSPACELARRLTFCWEITGSGIKRQLRFYRSCRLSVPALGLACQCQCRPHPERRGPLTGETHPRSPHSRHQGQVARQRPSRLQGTSGGTYYIASPIQHCWASPRHGTCCTNRNEPKQC